jgi:hypothetical protein
MSIGEMSKATADLRGLDGSAACGVDLLPGNSARSVPVTVYQCSVRAARRNARARPNTHARTHYQMPGFTSRRYQMSVGPDPMPAKTTT